MYTGCKNYLHSFLKFLYLILFLTLGVFTFLYFTKENEVVDDSVSEPKSIEKLFLIRLNQ